MRNAFYFGLFTVWALAVPFRGAGGEATVLFGMDSIRHKPTEATSKDKQKVPVGAAELVEGKVGKAVRFSFNGDLGPGFMTAGVKATPEWDRSAGFSFYLKGDGSTNWGGIEVIDRSDFGLRYGYCFPLDSTEWRKITVRWRDLIPELAGPLVDAGAGYAPSGFGNFWFGKWFYWRDYPAHSYAIDEVALENQLPDTEAKAVLPSPGLKRFREKLAARQPVTVVTMGDSLTDKRHWANRETVWCELLARQLQARFGSEVKLVNPARGGTTLSQNLILSPMWLRDAPRPDLVTIWFGFNDWDSGVRGPRYEEYLRLAAERIRRQTQGAADIVLLTTCPAFSRWETMKEMEDAARKTARETGVGLADVASEVRRLGDPDKALAAGCWAWDKTHLGPKGHALAADVVLRAIEAEQP